MYPLVLSPEEVMVLRLIIRMVLLHQISRASEEFRKLLRDPQRTDADEVIDAAFNQKVTNLIEMYHALEAPLVRTAILAPSDTSILNMPEEKFFALKKCAESRYSGSGEILLKIQSVQPALLAAFEAAEEQARAVNLAQNIPTAPGLN
jgi:hypothetical protein